MAKTTRMENIELKRGKRLEAIIREGIESGMTWDEIARDLDIARPTLRLWVRELGGRVTPPQRSIEFVSEEAVR